jgi:energy-coupling factor transporter ATP-binding protein EcfA2
MTEGRDLAGSPIPWIGVGEGSSAAEDRADARSASGLAASGISTSGLGYPETDSSGQFGAEGALEGQGWPAPAAEQPAGGQPGFTATRPGAASGWPWSDGAPTAGGQPGAGTGEPQGAQATATQSGAPSVGAQPAGPQPAGPQPAGPQPAGPQPAGPWPAGAQSAATRPDLAGPDEDQEPYVRVDARKLEQALLELRHPIVSVPLTLEAPGAEEARAERLKLLSQIDDYLLPRLRQSGAPILVALVGSTGAGKSTLLNSLAGKQVSATGIRRPTTNSPVLACHPGDIRWFAENVFLPTLPRVRQQGLVMPGRDGLLVLAASEGMPEGVAVLDTPDIDSVVQAHRDFANQFLDASDLWLFVTTARRYADAAVWEMLKDARDRGAALAIALSRVPPAATNELAAHFDAMLEANGLGDIRRFIIPETVITEARLPGDIAAPIERWLADTAKRDDRRVAVLTQTMSGVLDTFRDRIPALADHVSAQLAVRGELREAVNAAYAARLAEFDEAIRNGSLLRGEVLARWQDFAGTGDLLRTLQARRGRGRSKKQRLSARASALQAALHASLESLVTALASRAAEQAVAGWQRNPAGTALLASLADPGAGEAASAGAGGVAETDFVASALADLGVVDSARTDRVGPAALARATDALAGVAARVISSWQDHVLHLVREEKVTKRSVARVVSFDEESLALVLTIGVLGYEAPDSQQGDEAGALPAGLLTALFGAGLLRDIGIRARHDLRERVGLLFEEEARRFAAIIDAAGVPEDTASTELLQAGFTLESVR